MKKYLRLYGHILAFAVKHFFEYRLNSITRSFFFPAWQLGMYGMIKLAYHQTPMLGTWNEQEGILLYLICQLFFAFVYFTFFEGGARYFMDKCVRYGEFDFLLTKPVHPQFLAMFSRPELSPLLSFVTLSAILVHYLAVTPLGITAANVGAFFVVLIASYSIVFFTMGAYATLSFYTSQARQVVEIMDKAFEYVYYPFDLMGQPVRLVLLTILPVFYFGNVATIFLLGKANTFLLAMTVAMAVASFFLNRWAWQRGLKQYSSASS